MKIEELRKKIDEKDDELSRLFAERMALCKEIGMVKAKENKAITSRERENEIIVRVAKDKPEELVKYIALFYRNIFSVSKAYQSEFYSENAALGQEIISSVRQTPLISANIAVCGKSVGAVVAEAFPVTVVTEFKNTDGAVKAVKSGLCDFVALPCDFGDGFLSETVKKIEENDLNIVKITETDDVPTESNEKRAVSGRENLKACEGSIETKVKACDGLTGTNLRACAVLSAKPIILKGADRAAVVVGLKNSAGSLLLPVSRLAGAGLNVTEIKTVFSDKLKTFTFIEFECDVMQKETLNVIAELKNTSEYFRFLGAYRKTV